MDDKYASLLQKSAYDISQIDFWKDRDTTLITAVYVDEEKALKLIDEGFPLNNVALMEETALSAAARKGKLKIVEKLLAKKCDVNFKIGGQTALTKMCKSWQSMPNVESASVILKKLIEAKADLESTDYYSQSPLERSVQREKYDLVEILINGGCKLTIKNNPALFMTFYRNDSITSSLIIKKHLDNKDFNSLITARIVNIMEVVGDVDSGYVKIPKMITRFKERPLELAKRMRTIGLCAQIRTFGHNPDYLQLCTGAPVIKKSVIKELKEAYHKIYTEIFKNLSEDDTCLLTQRVRINNGDFNVLNFVIDYLL